MSFKVEKVSNFGAGLNLPSDKHQVPLKRKYSSAMQPVVGFFSVKEGTKVVKKRQEEISPVQQMFETHRRIRATIEKTSTKLSAEIPSCPPLSEEMEALQAINSSLKNSPEATKIVNYCATYVQNALKSIQGTSPQNLVKNPEYLKAQEFLAQIIYFADRDPIKTAAMLDKDPINTVNSAFDQNMHTLFFSIRRTNTVSAICHFQDGYLVESIQKPIGIAKILITNSGFLNIGLTEKIKKGLLDKDVSLDYEDNIARVLDLLRSTPSLKQKIQEVVAPSEPSYSSNTVIRTVLGMSPDTPVTDNDAKRTVLSASLSLLRQGPIGSSFATALGAELLSLRINYCLQDFASLIKNDKICRMVDGQEKDFQYVLEIADGDLNNQFEIDDSGMLEWEGAFVQSTPGILAACRAMGAVDNNTLGLAEFHTLISNAVKEVTKTSKNHSASEIIDALAQLINKYNTAALAEVGKFAFGSLTNNALLKVWELTIAGMAESRPTSLVRSNIIQSINQALSPVLKASNISESEVIQRINSTFLDTINDRMQLRFDPNIETSDASKGKYLEGGFVIYDIEGSDSYIPIIRVDNPIEFQIFVQKLLNITSYTVLPTLRVTARQDILKTMIENASKYVNDKDFLNAVLINYDPRNKNNPDPVTNWQQLERTPWVDKIRDDNMESLSVYMNIPKPAPATFVPTNAIDLLGFGIKFSKDLQGRYQYLDNDVPNQTFPCSTPKYSLSFMPEHPTMVAAVRDPSPPMQWINTNIVQKGLELSKVPVSQANKDAVVDYAAANLVPSEQMSKYQQIKDLLTDAVKQDINFRDLRNTVLSVLNSSVKINPNNLLEVSKMLDSSMLGIAFSDDSGSEWQKLVIHFANTHRSSGGDDIHLCMYFNPLINKIEIGKINANGGSLESLPQEEWVQNQPWSFFDIDLQSIS